jgi:diguanylate cyclase (GGDEF)-like protein
MNMSIRTKLFLSHFLAIALVSGSIGSYFYHSAIDNLQNSLRSRLMHSAAIVSELFDAYELAAIKTPQDAASPVIQENLALLRKLANANKDIAYIYIFRKNGNTIEFVLDSDPEDPGAIGEVYDEQFPSLLQGFSQLSVDSEITTDRWGSFISGYAPLAGGEMPHLIGLDMYADEAAAKLTDLKRKGFISLVMSLALAYLCCYFLAHNFVHRIRSLHQRCQINSLTNFSPKQKGDEIDELTVAFDLMLKKQQQTREVLENTVQDRTAELTESNNRLKQEIVERLKVASQLQEIARTDFLTGLINRREMTNLLHNLEGDENGEAAAIILLDIDQFKSINDNYGHDIGDEVLRELACHLNATVRDTDDVARWGGEEILILLRATNGEEAAARAEDIRKSLAEIQITTDSDTVAITGSFGVAEFDADRGVEQLLKMADAALYRAKGEGRNCVRLAEIPSATDGQSVAG